MLCRQNTYYAVVVGAIEVLLKAEPTQFTRRYRLLHNLRTAMSSVVFMLPFLPAERMEYYHLVFSNMGASLDAIAESEESSYSDILINLIIFCIEELSIIQKPVSEKVAYRLQQLVTCFPETDKYDAIRRGHRVFIRLAAELNITDAEVASDG